MTVMRTAHAFALLTALVAGTAPPADARPPHKKALADHFGPLLPPKLNDCRTCHQAPQGEQAEDRPHNAFGARLKQVRKELTRVGKKTDIMLRFQAIAD